MSEFTRIKVGVSEVEVANYTPHDVTVYSMDGETPLVTIPKSGTFVRVAETVRPLFEEGVPIVRIERDPNKIEGLPSKVEGRYIIVSDMTYQAAVPLGRNDLLRTGPAVRDDDGRIVGCKGLAV